MGDRDFSCGTDLSCETPPDARRDANGLGDAACVSYGPERPLFSKSSTWGGARSNAGGARPNSGPRAKPKPPPPPPRSFARLIAGPLWYVAETLPRQERSAAREILVAGFMSYLPLYNETRRDPGTHIVRKTTLPMFTGYVFVQFDHELDDWAAILRVSYVRGLISTPAGRPLSVTPGAVEQLRAGDADRLKLAWAPLPVFDAGSHVRIDDGPMTSFCGEVLSCDGVRTTIRVKLFGRMMEVIFPRHSLSSMGAE